MTRTSRSAEKYKVFTEIKISEDGSMRKLFHFYLTVNGNVVLCHNRAIGERILVKLAKKAVSVSAGSSYGEIIDEDGDTHIIDHYDPHKSP